MKVPQRFSSVVQRPEAVRQPRSSWLLPSQRVRIWPVPEKLFGVRVLEWERTEVETAVGSRGAAVERVRTRARKVKVVCMSWTILG